MTEQQTQNEPTFHIIAATYDAEDFEECATCGADIDGPGFMVTRDNGRSVRLTHHCSETHAIEHITPEDAR